MLDDARSLGASTFNPLVAGSTPARPTKFKRSEKGCFVLRLKKKKKKGGGAKTKDLCRKHGISDATFYNWKAKYAGMTVSEARRLKELEQENSS